MNNKGLLTGVNISDIKTSEIQALTFSFAVLKGSFLRYVCGIIAVFWYRIVVQSANFK